jgi:hypothetical protein
MGSSRGSARTRISGPRRFGLIHPYRFAFGEGSRRVFASPCGESEVRSIRRSPEMQVPFGYAHGRLSTLSAAADFAPHEQSVGSADCILLPCGFRAAPTGLLGLYRAPTQDFVLGYSPAVPPGLRGGESYDRDCAVAIVTPGLRGGIPRTGTARWRILRSGLRGGESYDRDCAVAFPGPGLRGGDRNAGTARWHSQDRDCTATRDAPGSFPAQLGHASQAAQDDGSYQAANVRFRTLAGETQSGSP